MKIVVGDVDTLELLLSKVGRISTANYIMCYDIDSNIVLLPIKSSRHSHVVVVRKIIASEAIKVLREKGFELFESCLVMPSE